MTTNMNNTALNGVFKGLTSTASGPGQTKTFFIRNLAEQSIYFYDPNEPGPWFVPASTDTFKIIKPPMSKIEQGQSSSIVVYTSTLTKLAFCSFHFITAGNRFEYAWTFEGQRALRRSGQLVVDSHTPFESMSGTLFSPPSSSSSSAVFRDIIGKNISIIDIYRPGREVESDICL